MRIPMRTNLKLDTCLFAVWLIAACGSDGGTGSNANRVLTKTAAASGEGQTAAVATPLPLALRVVLTEDGSPKPNATIKWTAVNGSVAPASSKTDGSGIATTTWTLGTIAGPQNAQAEFVGATGSPQIFSATGAPGSPAALTKVGGDLQTTTVGTNFPNPLQVQVSDAFGNGISGVTTDWAIISGPVTADGTTSGTDPQGIASMSVTAGGTTGSASIHVTSGAVRATTIAFDLTVAGAILDVSVGDIFFRSVRNNSENPAVDTVQVGQVVRWTVVSGSHTVRSLGVPSFPKSGSLTVAGTSTYTYLFTNPGTYQYDCSVHPAPAMSGTIVVTP
jgi:plastocyanin